MIAPYYKKDKITIYNNDYAEVLSQIKNKNIIIITDPPQGIGFKYKSGKELHSTPKGYGPWIKNVYKQLTVLVPDGNLIAIFQHYRYLRYLWEWFGEHIDIFFYARNFTALHGKGIENSVVPIVIQYKNTKKPNIRTKHKRRKINFFISDWRTFHLSRKKTQLNHPCPLPRDICSHIIYNFANTNTIIIDPFLGSGQILIAGLLLDHEVIGIEIEKSYCHAAIKNIENILQGETNGNNTEAAK